MSSDATDDSSDGSVSPSLMSDDAQLLKEKYAHLELAYEQYKENSTKRILELADKLETAEAEKIEIDNYREKDFQIENLMSTVDEKDLEISKLHQEKE